MKLSLLEGLTVTAGYGLVVYHDWPPNRHLCVAICNVILALAFECGLSWKVLNHYRHKDPGLWCTCILPLLISRNLAQDVSLLQLLALMSLMLFLWQQETSVFVMGFRFLIFLYIIIYTTFISIHITGLTVLAVLLHLLLSLTVPKMFPVSFTFGEVSLVTQMLAYCFYRSMRNLQSEQNMMVPALDRLTTVGVVGIALVVTVTFIITSPRLPGDASRVQLVMWVISVILVAVCVCLPVTYCLIGPAEIYRLLTELFVSHTSLLLIIWWLFCTSLSVGIVCFYGNNSSKHVEKHITDQRHYSASDLSQKENTQDKRKTSKIKAQQHNDMRLLQKHSTEFIDNPPVCDIDVHASVRHSKLDNVDSSDSVKFPRSNIQASTTVRKYFHAAILCVYIPGLLYHKDLLYLASVIASGTFIILEAVRVVNLQYLGETLSLYLSVFLDDQDKGDLMLTPIYLLIGCSLPLWIITSSESTSSILCFAGLLSVGIGDSFASIIGRKYGRIKWPGTYKSLEGTLGAIISQIIAVQILHYVGVPGATMCWPLVFSVILISCLEATTSQIDNLMMPVFALMLFNNILPK